MALKTRKFDVTKFLETDQGTALYLEALKTGDAATVAHALARGRPVARKAPGQARPRESIQSAQLERESGTGDCIAGREGVGPGACGKAYGAGEGCETGEG